MFSLERLGCATLPHLFQHDSQSYRAGRGPLLKAEPTQETVMPPTSTDGPVSFMGHCTTPIREPPVSFAALPAQLLPWSIPTPETPPNLHSYGTTNTNSSFTQPVDGGNLSPHYLPYYSSGITTHSEPDDMDMMDCSPLSPIPPSDVDMDILIDTPPAPPSYDHAPWAGWNAIPEYVPVPSFHHNSFVAPQPLSFWETPVQEPPPSAIQYSSRFAMPTTLDAPSFHAAAHTHGESSNLQGHTFVSAALEPPLDFSNLNYLPPSCHPCTLDATSDQTQDTTDMCWQEQPYCIGTPHPTSIATLLGEFERTLTLVADETSEADLRSGHKHRLELTPARVEDSPNFEREATEPLEEGQDQSPACFLSLRGLSPPPFERESTEPLEESDPPGGPPPLGRDPTKPFEQGEEQLPASFMDLIDQPRQPPGPAFLPTLAPPGPPTIVHPLARPRPPTPPLPRRPSKSVPGHNTHTTRLAASANRLTIKLDCAELPTAQSSVQAYKGAQLQLHAGASLLRRSPPCRSDTLGDDNKVGGGGSGWGLPPRRRTPLCSRRRLEEREGEEVMADEGEHRRPERCARTKRTRFVVPDSEDEREQDVKASPPLRPRRTGSNNGTEQASGPGPLRSILRNKNAMPYDKALGRRRVRRASVP
ncbi:hypothetical protein HD554DRAFT_2087729 [Boletus coccyginus]|nr:hypothetical protein HD554DRAFT_2087729 [Boletus coccyginus]